MAKKKTTPTTTPSNKLEQAAKVKPAKGAKGKAAISGDPDAKPLQATIGEVLIAKGTKPIDEVQLINFDRRLPCALTTAEITDRARRIKELRRTIKQSETMLTTEKEEFDKKKKSLESDISKANAEVANLSDEIGDEAEYRDVRCQRVFDYKLMQVREVRTDMSPPKQLQEPRAMTAREVEEGYTNDNGARKAESPTPEKSKFPESDDGIIDDTIPFGDDKSDDVDFA